MKKRTFLLFEILIAFLLVSLCAVPLVRQPLMLFRAEMQTLERLERERLVEWTYTEIKEKLLKNEIPWEKLPSKGGREVTFSLPAATIQIPGYATKTIERTYTVSCRGEKIGMNEEIFRSLHIQIKFSPPIKSEGVYKYQIAIQKLPLLNPSEKKLDGA